MCTKRSAIASVLASAYLMLAFPNALAQGATPAQGVQGLGTSLSVSIPTILLVSIDIENNRTLNLEGVFGEKASAASSPGLRRFLLEPGRAIGLGEFRVFSNRPGAYRISIRSLNQAMLVPIRESAEDAESSVGGVSVAEPGSAWPKGIPYSLILDGTPVRADADRFFLLAKGKTSTTGASLRLGIQIDDLPGFKAPRSKGKVYADTLFFDIQAE
ncbi:MAG TPA: hypothetical protein VIO60_07500 [Rectinemataceae bacterium]